MRTIDILSPVAAGPTEAIPLAPRILALRGCRVGLRVDRAWRSFQWFAEELADAARARGARDVVFLDPGVRIGSPDTERDKIRAFAAGVDLAVVGLGT